MKKFKYALKDNIVAKGKKTQAASNLLENYKSSFNSTVVEKLDGEFLHVNMDEFGMGSFGLNSAYGLVSVNGKSVGGSSSGCAASVLLGHCEVGIGTDTGGSIRLPAAFTNLLGFKPSYGMISRYGVIPYAQSLDTVGIITKEIDTLTKTFRLLEGFDNKDPTSIPNMLRDRGATQLPILKLGVMKISNKEFLHGVADIVGKLKNRHKVKVETLPIEIPYFEVSLACYYIIATAEAFSSLNKYSGELYPKTRQLYDSSKYDQIRKFTRSHFGHEVQQRLKLGEFVLSRDEFDNWFQQATKVRRLIRDSFYSLFNTFDYILLPTTLMKAPAINEALNFSSKNYTTDNFTVPTSLSGLPTLAIPTKDVSVQCVGPYLKDYQLLHDFKFDAQ
eukprot:NODE_510_length_6666_cov_0.619918.p2 type:complete len:389 gc:universal NODE_510_length_6666_cov_0.619918:1618-452(-)